MIFGRNLLFAQVITGCITPAAVCQSLVNISVNTEIQLQSTNSAEQLYRSLLKDSTDYLNGRVNTFRYPRARGNPFYGDGNWIKGSFTLDGRQFEDISLRYEILNDQLLCLYYAADGPSIIEINRSFVRQFSFNGHSFVNFNLIKPEIPVPEGGYYEELASGRASMYVKWKKFVTPPSSNHPAEYYVQKTTYILIHGNMHRLTNRKSIMMAFKDHGDKIREYFQQHRISVRHSSDQELAAMANYYNSLY